MCVLTARAQTPAACDSVYAEAEAAYYEADFERALELVRPCAEQDALPDTVRARAYRLRALVHLGRNDPEAARLAVESLVDLRPSYEPEKNQVRPDFVALVQKVRESRDATAEPATEDSNRRWVRWTIGSVGAAALGTAAALLIGGGGDGGDGGNGTEPLPPPPQPPQ